jgi:hypothetical protein
MHAHLSIGAGGSQRAVIADIASFDDPYLAGGRAQIGGYLRCDHRERPIEVRAAGDFFENLTNFILFGFH